jgi:hypothetical protein
MSHLIKDVIVKGVAGSGIQTVVGERPFVRQTLKFYPQFLLSFMHYVHHINSDLVNFLLWLLSVVLLNDLELLLVLLVLVLHLDRQTVRLL